MEAMIKPIDNREIANVRSITWQSWMHAYARFIPERDLQAYFDEHYSAEALERIFDDACVCGFVAEVAGNAVGYAKGCFNKTENRFYINSIYVLPDHQGGGIGTMLLNACIERARSYNVSEVWLGVMAKNVEALAWYKKIGFRFVREEPFIMGQTTVSHLIGYKPI